MNVIFKILFNETCQHFEDLCYSLNQYFPGDLYGGCSVTQSCLTLCNPMDCSMPGFPVPHHLLKFAQVHVHCISDTIQPSHLLMPPSPSSLNLSQHQVLFVRWPKYWRFSISPSSEYSGLISLKINWFDLLAVQGTLRSLLQHPSSKASILWRSAFLIIQLSQVYMTTGKTISSVQFSSVAQLCLTLCDPVDCRMPGFPIHHQSQGLLKLMSIESLMPSNHFILRWPFIFLPSIFPSIRVFSNESVLSIRGPNGWSFNFSISPSDEYSGLISFTMDWFDLLAGQGTLKSLLQHHSSKASILWHSAFFIVQLLHTYMTTGKTIALTRSTFVGKAMSLLFNMLSR